jgi:SNF2 family DNA or RNA helicase
LEQKQPPPLPDSLRPYQQEGVVFLADSSSALLADEMGLGKTVQVSVALALLFKSPDISQSLVVVPSSLQLNWYRELARWAPDLSVRIVDGSPTHRSWLYRLPVNVLVASYDHLRRDVDILSSRLSFDVVILDEAQHIKNPNSKTALSSRRLKRVRSWALTGTPVENSVSDLLAIFRFVRPGLLSAGMDRHLVHELIQPFFLRRRKQEVLSEIPDMIVQDLPLQLRGAQLAAYQDVWRNRRLHVEHNGGSISETHLFALLTRLKQLCNFHEPSGVSSKLDVLKTIIEQLSSESDKVLLFSQYVETLRWIEAQLQGEVPCDLYHGSLSASERDIVLETFRKRPGPRILLMSLRAGGTGLNIPEASHVVLFDRWWNPATEAQAIARAHRFGRRSVLHVLRFMVEATVEERVSEILAEKQLLFEHYVDEARSADVLSLNRSDLLKILSLEEE